MLRAIAEESYSVGDKNCQTAYQFFVSRIKQDFVFYTCFVFVFVLAQALFR
jgi:hypothetical protein